MMHGGPTVRSRKIRIIKNAPMFLPLSRRIQLWNTRRIIPGTAADYHPLGECDTAKVAAACGFSDLRQLRCGLMGPHNICQPDPST